MKKTSYLFLMLILAPVIMIAQTVKGVIYADTTNILVVKVWGTHQERGYALGYLTGDKITDIINNYIKPEFGPFYSSARSLVIQGVDLSIPQEYKDEAQSIIEGMDAAGLNTTNLDQTDILVGNTFLDISNLLFKKSGMNCSALMSWNDATAGTDLDGKSVITRHLDWEYSPVINRNHMIVVHFPQETTESKWLLVGFSGMMSILSGFNPDFSAFQNMMDDFSASGLHNKQYLPIWFALRKAIEAADYNNDGARNVQDVKAALSDCVNGFADGFIVSSLARSNTTDSLVAMVAELANTAPIHTYRYSDYPDSIPGDNLYTANYQIARNNLMHFCSRYNGIRSHIGDGTQISLDTSWNLMRDYSHLSTNTQFMQFAPELDYLRISVYRDGQPAYMNDPVVFNLDDLFQDPTMGIPEGQPSPGFSCYPNPAIGSLHFTTPRTGSYRIEVFDLAGKTVVFMGNYNCTLPLDITSLRPGCYSFRLTGISKVYTGTFMKK